MPFTQYYGQFQGLRGNLGGVPPWGRFILMLAAVPGLLVVLVGALLLIAGVLLILLLVLPVYRIVRFVIPSRATSDEIPSTIDDPSSPGRKAVESRIV